jgi:two-component system nitrogen regulation response regulator GlnG
MERENFHTLVAYDGESALRVIHSERPDVMLLDIKMPGIDGMDVLKQALKIDPALRVVVVTGHTDIPRVVQTMRMGAYYYVAKPFNHKEILRVVVSALAERALKQTVEHVGDEFKSSCSLPELMGPSDVIARISAEVTRVAQSNFTVLLLGETGTGKELVARSIHSASPRAKGPFVTVDCGAIPETLLESDLFGHEKGAFTGADVRQLGKFEMARDGTLFLDEISNMPIDSQAKLLRALQEKVIYRVGGSKPISIDVRIVAACNQDLESSTAKGDFRQDLFFRLNEFSLRIPPLRERQEDILYLGKRFLNLTNAELHKHAEGFSKAVINLLLSYEWPGNVRQLRSTIRRAVLLADDEITIAHLDIARLSTSLLTPAKQVFDWDKRSLKEIVRETTTLLERNVLSQVLHITDGNKAKAARLLRIDYKTIHSKVKYYGIPTKGGNSHGEEARQ